MSKLPPGAIAVGVLANGALKFAVQLPISVVLRRCLITAPGLPSRQPR
jgi:hypothetical protein